MITLVDENDFQWLALGVLGTLLVVLLIVVIVLWRRLRALDRQAERMERREPGSKPGGFDPKPHRWPLA